MLGQLFAGEAPERQIANLTPTDESVIADEVARAKKPIEDRYKTSDQTIDAGKKAFDTFGGPGLLGGFNSAIKDKYSGLLGTSLQFQRDKERLGARQKQLDQMQRAQAALIAKQQVENDIFSKVLENQQMREAARAEAINSIVGAGAIVGGYAMAQRGTAQQKPSIQQDTVGGYKKNNFAGETTATKMRAGSMGNDAGYNKSRNYRMSLEDPYETEIG